MSIEIRPDRRELFERLFAEFLTSYAAVEKGRKHASQYAPMRDDARRGYRDLLDAQRRGEDITDLALLRFLPYNDSKSNRERGAWCHFAPAVTGDVKAWFEKAPHLKTRPSDWPHIATDIVAFVRRCTENPSELESACRDLAAKDYMRGFQSGMLTPILNALSPEHFSLINNRSREVVGFFVGERLGNSIDAYPSTNGAVKVLCEALSSVLASTNFAGEFGALSAEDRLDMFCHWLVAEKKYPLRDVKYWKVAPGEGACLWDKCREEGMIAVGWDELGDLSGLSKAQFDVRREQVLLENPEWTKKALGQAWRFSRISEGDRIVANKGKGEVVGVGTVTGPYSFVSDEPYGHRLPVEWDDTTRRRVDQGSWGMTLCKLDQATFDEVVHAPEIPVEGLGPEPGPRGTMNPPYSLERVAEECYQDLAEVRRWVRAVERKGQIVFFGPPGTGKTFCAERLAKHLVEERRGFVRVVQFHPSYSYEEFIEGIRPRAGVGGALEYPTLPGRFLDACHDACARPNDPCVLIIDEINRANLSRVFGELMLLLEYRQKEVPLASGSMLQVPPNLKIIGTMNTADRSIALIDHALRRRFAFIRLPPRAEALVRFHDQNESFDPQGLIEVLARVNQAIADPNYAVGVSFFMRPDIADEIADVWEMEIEPYLEEFFFDRPDRVDGFRWTKVEAEVMAANEREPAEA